MTNQRTANAIALLTVLLPAFAFAHHSVAVFDQSKTIELRGVIVDFKLRSPHSSFIVDGRSFTAGRQVGAGVERWEIESEALPVLRTMGIDAQTFKAGDAITITGTPHRDPEFKFAHAATLKAADGREYSFAASNRIFSPSLRPVAGAAGSGAGEQVAVVPASGIKRLQGRWQQPWTPTGTESALALNEAGKAAWRNYDRKQSPANTCETMTVPDVFAAPFYLFDVRLSDGSAVLHNEAYDIVRTVPLNGKPAPADPKGQFGIVSGRIEGTTLVVESRGYPASKWGLGAEVQIQGGGADVPSSEQKVVTEKYSVSDDGQTLVYDYTLNDPAYMTAAYRGRVELTRVPESAQMYPYNCDVESAAMWSRTQKDKPLRVGQ